VFAYPFMVEDKYRSHAALETQKVPMLWIHGTADQVIPFGQGQKLFDSYGGPKESLVIQGGNHSNLWISGGREKISEFFK